MKVSIKEIHPPFLERRKQRYPEKA